MEEEETKYSTELSSLNKGTIYYDNLRLAKSYKFENFDILEEFKDRKNFTMTITSKRCTGKSVLMRDLCSKIKGWYEQTYVFSLTADMQPDLFDFVKKENITIGFDEAKISHIWDKQKEIIEKLQKTKTVKPENYPKILLIFDDLISLKEVKKSEILKRLFVAGRHLFFACIFLSQQFTSIAPVLRVNVDIAVAFYLDSYDNREQFSKAYLSTKNTKLGIMVFEEITKKAYQAIIIMNNKISSDPQEYIRTYTAQLKVSKFHMGKKDTVKTMTHSLNFGSISPAAEGFNGSENPLGLKIAKTGIKL